MEVRGFSIRDAEPADLPELLECLRNAFESYRESYTEKAFIDTVLTPELLQKRFSAMQILVATDASQIIGTIAYRFSNGEAYIRGMAVRPDYQGAGVAAALLARAESDLRRLHCRAVTLGTTSPLRRAMSFYEKHGFRRTGDSDSFFGMVLFTYRKVLSSDQGGDN